MSGKRQIKSQGLCKHERQSDGPQKIKPPNSLSSNIMTALLQAGIQTQMTFQILQLTRNKSYYYGRISDGCYSYSATFKDRALDLIVLDKLKLLISVKRGRILVKQADNYWHYQAKIGDPVNWRGRLTTKNLYGSPLIPVPQESYKKEELISAFTSLKAEIKNNVVTVQKDREARPRLHQSTGKRLGRKATIQIKKNQTIHENESCQEQQQQLSLMPLQGRQRKAMQYRMIVFLHQCVPYQKKFEIFLSMYQASGKRKYWKYWQVRITYVLCRHLKDKLTLQKAEKLLNYQMRLDLLSYLAKNKLFARNNINIWLAELQVQVFLLQKLAQTRLNIDLKKQEIMKILESNKQEDKSEDNVKGWSIYGQNNSQIDYRSLISARAQKYQQPEDYGTKELFTEQNNESLAENQENVQLAGKYTKSSNIQARKSPRTALFGKLPPRSQQQKQTKHSLNSIHQQQTLKKLRKKVQEEGIMAVKRQRVRRVHRQKRMDPFSEEEDEEFLKKEIRKTKIAGLFSELSPPQQDNLELTTAHEGDNFENSRQNSREIKNQANKYSLVQKIKGANRNQFQYLLDD